jgi:hypothetical protein
VDEVQVCPLPSIFKAKYQFSAARAASLQAWGNVSGNLLERALKAQLILDAAFARKLAVRSDAIPFVLRVALRSC